MIITVIVIVVQARPVGRSLGRVDIDIGRLAAEEEYRPPLKSAVQYEGVHTVM